MPLLLFLDTPVAIILLGKSKSGQYWPDYYKDTMEMVSYKFNYLPLHPLDHGF